VIENKRSKQRQLQWLYGEDYFLENVLFGTHNLENVLFCTLKYMGVCGCGCYHVYFSRLYYAYRVHFWIDGALFSGNAFICYLIRVFKIS
jgi:hypothetical protein